YHGYRAAPRDARLIAELGDDLVVEGDWMDRGQELIAGDHLGQPGGRRESRLVRHAAHRDDHREADRQRPDGQRRSAAVADDRRTRQALLHAEGATERETGE